ncbi:pentatricopeptide repeat-containing protein [Canna indica]|uniref:Pentatricopeptide repeat-containing protein n=1 Tax=Canna indica TaxID=4628 RepID=A0AAQ3L5C1_9LILI|nr:pentatricopeptide repeat-containing protein [Canna indica]
MCSAAVSVPLHQKIPHLLTLCGGLRHLNQIHGLLITSSFVRSPTLSSLLLRRATDFGCMDYAERLFFTSSPFDGVPPHVLLYNAMIRGYAHNGPQENSLLLFEEMLQRDLKPNSFTYPFVLDSCTRLGNYGYGKKAHGQLIKAGYDAVASIASPLFKFYVEMERSCIAAGSLVDARRVFDGMLTKSIGMWNKMIFEYVNLGDVESARRLFDDMLERDVVSWNSMLSGYVRAADVKRALDFFGRMPAKDIVSWTMMIAALSDAGNLIAARRLFDEMPERNVVSWNCMLASYTHHGKFQQACNLFLQMHSQGVTPDGYTFVSALSACAHLGDLGLGKWIHINLIRDGLRLGAKVGTALIEMYAKCSDIDSALKVFVKMTEKDVFCWNVMIKAFAMHGRIVDSLKLFESMIKKGLPLNDLTFMSVLFACSHGGLVQEGRRIFSSMEKDFKISPRMEHYGCLIDLLCRNGQIEEAQAVVKEMPYKPDIAVWGALLGACRVKNDIKSAEQAMEKIQELETDEGGVYVLLSNMYATSSQYNEASKARQMMEEKNIWKTTGCSSVLEASVFREAP